jgi:hypothetical protein
VYEGWKIYTYKNKIPKAEEPTIKNTLKTWFNSDDWSFSENTHRVVIFYAPTKEEISVTFQEVKYGSERDEEIATYHIVFESVFFGLRAGGERAHQELCKKTFQKIPWKKLGFLLQDNSQIPIPKTTFYEGNSEAF